MTPVWSLFFGMILVTQNNFLKTFLEIGGVCPYQIMIQPLFHVLFIYFASPKLFILSLFVVCLPIYGLK
jgi:hypothetical protein